MGWLGWAWVGIELAWVGLDCVGMGWAAGFSWLVLAWVGLGWLELRWDRLGWAELAWVGLSLEDGGGSGVAAWAQIRMHQGMQTGY